MDTNTKFSQSESAQSQDVPAQDLPTQDVGLEDPKASELSTEFVGRWTKLISTTNWEKGRIIQEWRDALMGSEAPPATYSDEAWSRRVGGVSAQHVGRLRRVHERFGNSYSTYAGLYWTHFLAAMDWEDAEMWLEGAAQSDWSISEMRRTRWEALGSDPKTQPKESDIRVSSDDEDFVPLNEVDEVTGDDREPFDAEQTGPRYDEPDFGDESESASIKSADDQGDETDWEGSPAEQITEESPFARLPSLPVDVAEALEQFKLAIIRHRAMAWSEVGQSEVVQTLDALKIFALQ